MTALRKPTPPAAQILEFSRSPRFIEALIKAIADLDLDQGDEVTHLKRRIQRRLHQAGFSKREQRKAVKICAEEVAKWVCENHENP